MPTEAVIVATPQGIRKFRRRLAEPIPALRAIGAFLVSESAKAFTEQRLGEYRWPERYPQQEEPFINIAGVLDWARDGKSGSPPERFFSRRPALVGTRRLMRGTAFTVEGRAVVVGNMVPYASLHQYGGTSRTPITAAAKSWIARWTETKRGRPYSSKLYPLLNLPVWEQEVYQRPFIGVTPTAADEIRRILEVFVATGGTR